MTGKSEKSSEFIRTAVIGGSGSSLLLPEMRVRCSHDVTTPYGKPSSEITEAVIGETAFYMLSRHGPHHTIPPHAINYRANLWALSELGVNAVVAIAAVGGIRPQLNSGDLMVPDQLIDYTWSRPSTFFDGKDGQVGHLEMTSPYSGQLRDAIVKTANLQSVNLFNGGVYAVTQGPRFETPAEIDRIERDGGDVVGMTGMPEAALAAERGLHYACVALVVNPAAGRGDGNITADSMREAFNTGMHKLNKILKNIIQTIDNKELSVIENNILYP